MDLLGRLQLNNGLAKALFRLLFAVTVYWHILKKSVFACTRISFETLI